MREAQTNVQDKTKEYLEAKRLHLDNYKLHLESFDKTASMHLAAVTVFAAAAIRGVFFLNGAAAIAALTANIQPETKLYIVKNGSWGAICAVICAGVSYLAQRVYMAEDLHDSAERWSKAFHYPAPQRAWHEKGCLGNSLSVLSIIFFCLSLGKFIHSLACLPPLFQG
ncbi:hypothetical protein LJC23_06610 [Desulfovibrio sp. OttesenSCG-928-I05]|nr:hypothetical protein [Desulfovibrio sp. OttesenSCG-928-I05]